MTDDRAPRTPWPLWLLVAIGALLVMRTVIATASRLVELAFLVAAGAGAVVVLWRLVVAGSRGRRRP